MGVIVPAILPSSREDLEGKLSLLAGLTDSVQIDVVDGKFASPATWPYVGDSQRLAERFEEGTMLPALGRFSLEIDLMVERPEDVVGLWIAAGAQRITVHLESTERLKDIVEDLSVRYGHAKDFAPGLISFGLSIGNDTDISALDPYMEHVDYVQFMGISEIGKQGQPFDLRVLSRVRTFRQKYPDMVIQVDGAVSAATAAQLLDAGVDRLVVGSALWKAPSLRDEILRLKNIVHEHNAYT